VSTCGGVTSGATTAGEVVVETLGLEKAADDVAVTGEDDMVVEEAVDEEVDEAVASGAGGVAVGVVVETEDDAVVDDDTTGAGGVTAGGGGIICCDPVGGGVGDDGVESDVVDPTDVAADAVMPSFWRIVLS
jgi:hypothetical protein